MKSSTIYFDFMKQRYLKIFLLTFALVQAAACEAKKPPEPKPAAETTKPAPKVPRPKISVDQAVYDFGKVPVNGRVSHVFKIKNTGAANLTIDRTEGS